MFCLSKLLKPAAFPLVVIAGFLCSSCTTEAPPKYMKRHKVHDLKLQYPPLKDYQVELSLVSSRRSFNPGYDAVLTYKFTNTGKKALRIDEWYMNDQDNVKLYYCPWQKNITTFKASELTCIDPVLKKPVRRFELVLNPGNSVLIRKDFSFVKALPPDKAPPHNKYFVMASLNLKSIKAKSTATEIELKQKTIYTQGNKL